MPETLAERIADKYDPMREMVLEAIRDFAREAAGQIRAEKSSVVSGPGTELLNQTREEDAEVIEREGGVAK